MKLADWMSAAQLDDDEVAKLAEVDRATISRLRRGRSVPSLALAGRIKVASQGAVTADDFLPDDLLAAG